MPEAQRPPSTEVTTRCWQPLALNSICSLTVLHGSHLYGNRCQQPPVYAGLYPPYPRHQILKRKNWNSKWVWKKRLHIFKSLPLGYTHWNRPHLWFLRVSMQSNLLAKITTWSFNRLRIWIMAGVIPQKEISWPRLRVNIKNDTPITEKTLLMWGLINLIWTSNSKCVCKFVLHHIMPAHNINLIFVKFKSWINIILAKQNFKLWNDLKEFYNLSHLILSEND